MQDHRNRTTPDTAICTDITTRRPYAAPALVDYGAVRDLTAGGSGHAQESSSGNLRRP